MNTLSAGWQTFFYALAIGFLLFEAVRTKSPEDRVRFDLIGIACFVFVFFWNALAAG